jgi:hypothetical protein
MYCPSCGKENSIEQKFCRGCGLSLEKIVLALDEVSPVPLDNDLREKTRRVDRLLIGAATLGITPFFALILYAILYKIIIVKGQVGQGLAFLAFIVGIVTCALLAIYRSSLEKAARQRTQTAELKQGIGTAKLLNESHFEPVPSVTDRTTELLHVEREVSKKNPS